LGLWAEDFPEDLPPGRMPGGSIADTIQQ
jgi:hypothetical protein